MPIKVLARANKRAEILIHEAIGENWYGDGLTSKRFIKDLEALGDVQTLVVRINSPGGAVFDGIAIYNALKHHAATKEVHIDGLAASAASFIAMCGDTITMGEGSMMMIHNPWTFAMGDASDMREVADMLDKVGDSLIDIYHARTGIERGELKTLLDAETWLSASDAIEKGFADEKTGATEDDQDAAAAARQGHLANFKKFADSCREAAAEIPLRVAAEIFKSAPADATPKETDMPQTAAASAKPADIPNQTQDQVAAAVREALAAEKARREAIRNIFTPFAEEHGTLLNACIDDQGCTVDNASKQLLDAVGKQFSPSGGHIVPGADSRDKFRSGVQAALLARAGIEKDDRGNEYRGRSMVAIAEQSLILAGLSVRGKTPREIASMVFAAHSTSDFPLVLSNTAGKALLKAFETFPSTWQRWCSTRPVSDFKQVSNLRLGSFNSLALIPEGGEYKAGTIGENREVNQAVTKGRKIPFTRQMLINDDLGAFVGFAQKLGQAAKRTLNADAYSVLTTNAALSDTVALFHATHSNLSSGGAAAISKTSVSAAKAAMRKQKDVNSNDYLNITPKFLLVPVALEDTALEFITSATDRSQSNPNVKNIHQNTLETISDPVLDANSVTAYYFVADPAIAELVQAVFLDGSQEPFIDEQVDFDTDALEMKVRMDYGFAAVDYRAGNKQAGA